jgi:hypothetical protein
MKTSTAKTQEPRPAVKGALSKGTWPGFPNLADVVVLPGESTEEFNNLLAACMEEFDPRTVCETSMVERMVVSRWRQRRTWGFMTFAYSRPESEATDQAAQAGYAKAIDDLHRAEDTYGRLYASARRQLAAFRQMR